MYVNEQTYANGSIVNIDLATLLTSWIVYHQIHQTERVGQIAIFINNPKKGILNRKFWQLAIFRPDSRTSMRSDKSDRPSSRWLSKEKNPNPTKKNQARKIEAARAGHPWLWAADCTLWRRPRWSAWWWWWWWCSAFIIWWCMMVMINIANMNMIARWYARFPVRSEPTI